MRHPCLRALAIAAVALLPTASSANPLKSLTDRSDILGWEAVGRLNLEGRGYCTASLIAPNLVMTAAHCVFDEAAERIHPDRLVFQAGLRDGDAIATGRIARIVAPKRYNPVQGLTAKSVRLDVALLELATPIPAATADPFPLARVTGTGWPVTVLSYGRGRSNAMSREIGCSIKAAQEGLMAFDCQAEPGSSGAPIFDMSGRSPRIVSIVSGTGVYAGGRAVFGMELASVVSGLKTALRTGEGVWPDPEPTTRRVIGPSERSTGSARFVRP